MESFKKIIVKVLNVLVFIIAFLFAKACTAGFHNTVYNTTNVSTNSAQTSNVVNKRQLLTDASKIRGFTGANTDFLEYYCKDSGYVPYKYINAFNKRFAKTISNMNNIVNTYSDPHTEALLDKKIRAKMMDVYDNDLKKWQKEYNINKYDYCKMHDDEEEINMIEEKIQTFKTHIPNYFLD